MNDDRRLDLVSHLDELRGRLLRCLLYATAGMGLAWVFYDYVYGWLMHPVAGALKAHGGEIQVISLMEGFWTQCQISLVVGLVAVSPLLLYELWSFAGPGLTPRERRAVRPVFPAAGVLFAMGVVMGYLLAARFISVMLKFVPKDAVARLTLNYSVLLLAKFLLAFGLAFQLPIVMVILARLGIIDSRLLVVRWREAVVCIFLIAAVATPSPDPITMTLAAMPLVMLYLGTIQVIKWMERRAARDEEAPSPPGLEASSVSGDL